MPSFCRRDLISEEDGSRYPYHDRYLPTVTGLYDVSTLPFYRIATIVDPDSPNLPFTEIGAIDVPIISPNLHGNFRHISTAPVSISIIDAPVRTRT